MTIKIDKSVPLPEKYARGDLFPFAKMKIGDSFVVPDGRASSAKAAATQWHRAHKERFTTRIVQERGQKALRVWRTK